MTYYNEVFEFLGEQEKEAKYGGFSKEYEQGALDFSRWLDREEERKAEKLAKVNQELGLITDNLKKPENESDDDEARRLQILGST